MSNKILADCIGKRTDSNNNVLLEFRVSQPQFKAIAECCKAGPNVLSFKKYTGKRSASQNSLFWKLVGLIACEQEMSPKTVCKNIMIDANSRYTLIEAPLEAEDTLKRKYKFVYLLSKSFEDDSRAVFQCFYGTSELDSAEFGKLIDKAKEYCYELDIPVDV